MKAKVGKIITEAYDTKTFVLDLVEPIDYKAAQFIMLNIGIEGVPVRAFSVSNATNPKSIQITARIYPGGRFTSYLDNIKEGDIVEVKGPYGKFLYEKNQTKLIGGGTGIAPLRSIMYSALNDKQDVVLLYSDKTEKDLIYKDELEKLAEEKIKLQLFVTREPYNKKYTLGRITKQHLSKLGTEGVFYVCGRPEFVTDIVGSLKDLGINEEQIKYEKF